MIAVLCAHCGEHILNADRVKLSWPLTRQMFNPAKVFNDWNLPANLMDAWCPYCEQFPFYADMENGGLKARLRIRGENNRERFIEGRQMEDSSNALDQTKFQEAQQVPQPGAVSASGESGKRGASGQRRRGQGSEDRKLAGKKNRGRPKKAAR